MIAGGVSGLLTRGIKGAVIGAASGYITFGIGELQSIGIIGQALLHGTAQGVFSAAQGGDFLPAFAAGTFAKFGSHYLGSALGVNGKSLGQTHFSQIVAKSVGAAAIGGTGSVIAGGKFQNGAASGAFVQLFNDVVHLAATIRVPSPIVWAYEKVSGAPMLANGVSVGIAVSYPGLFGGEWDAGLVGQANLRGGGGDIPLTDNSKLSDATIGMAAASLSYGGGSVKSLDGMSVEAYGQGTVWGGFVGASFGKDAALDLATTYVGVRYGGGLGVGVVGSLTGTLTVRDAYRYFDSTQRETKK